MDRSLKFEKIHQDHTYAGTGMGGNIFIVCDKILNLAPGAKLHVDMETEHCICKQDNFNRFNTKNCWEYYYDQIKKPSSIMRFFEGQNNLNYSNTELGNSELHKRFDESFQLKGYIKEFLSDYYDSNIKGVRTLGAQIRLTDMVRYHNTKPFSAYLSKLKDILDNDSTIEQVFVSTDDSTIIPKLQNSINVPLIYHKDFIRATNERPLLDVYDRNIPIKENHQFQLSLECILEIYTLMMCDDLLRAHISAISNVAILLSKSINKVYKV